MHDDDGLSSVIMGYIIGIAFVLCIMFIGALVVGAVAAAIGGVISIGNYGIAFNNNVIAENFSKE